MRLEEIKARSERDAEFYDKWGLPLPEFSRDIAWLIARVERLEAARRIAGGKIVSERQGDTRQTETFDGKTFVSTRPAPNLRGRKVSEINKQCRQVLEVLRASGWISAMAIIEKSHVVCFTKRVSELRRAGYVIDLHDTRTSTRRLTLYRLVSEPAALPSGDE
jgi:Helix-turn-helix domain